MAKGSEAAFHALLIIVIVVLTLLLIFLSIKQSREREKELNEERYSLINTLNSYELFRKSLEATWRISTAQAIFRASKGLDLEGGYWYSYNPSSGRSMAIPQSGCNSANPKICLPTMQGVSSVLAAYMQDYTGSIEGRVIPVNLISMKVNGIKTLIWASRGSVTSKISHLTSAEFASGKTKIGREEEIETSLDSNFMKMVFAGYLTVQAAAELSDEVINQDKLKYNSMVPMPAPPASPTLGFGNYSKKAGDYIANKLKGAEEFYTSDIPVQGSRILHVKIDPEGKPESPPVPDGKTEVWAFHLTDDANYPLKDPGPVPVTSFRKFQNDDSFLATPKGKKVCNVFSENEESGSSNDYISTWYIYPGGKIARGAVGVSKIYDGIKDYIAGSVDYDAMGDGNKKASFDPAASTEAVGEEPYTKKEFDKCSDEGPCGLLETQKEDGSGACSGSGSNHCFIPKYELLCDGSGYWRVCNEAAQDARLQAGEKTYRCNNKAWEAVTEAVNMELIVSTGVNYYPSTLGVLPEQGGLVMKYDASSVFAEEPKYYKDTGSGFSKEPFSLTVKAKDYLPVLDCSKYPDGTRFALERSSYEIGSTLSMDMMCYQDTAVPRLNIFTGLSSIDAHREIYTCDRWGFGVQGLNTDYYSDTLDNDLRVGQEIGISPNKYQCIGDYDFYFGGIFCKEHEDGIRNDKVFTRCCTQWNWNDVYTVFAGKPYEDTYNCETDPSLCYIDVIWKGDRTPFGNNDQCGSNTFCSGDKVVDAGKGEICDTRNFACTLFDQTEASSNGCAYYCDPKGHKFQCNPHNSCSAKHTFNDAYPNSGCNERFCAYNPAKTPKPTYDGHANFADSTDDVTATTCYNTGECRLDSSICKDPPEEGGASHPRNSTWEVPSTCNEYRCPTAAEERDNGICPTERMLVGSCLGGAVCDGSGNCVAPTPAPTPEPTATPTPTIILY